MLYQFGFQLHLLDMFKVLIFVLPFCIYLFSSTFENKFIRFIIIMLAIVISIVFLLIFFIMPIYSYFGIKQNINEGNVYIIEGEVNNFETPVNSFGGHNSETFTISNVKFSYYGTENYGYSKFLCNGGVITGDGQNLRITYCHDPITNEIVICYIEKL